jgi:single-strand DNA-binding protein
VYETPITVVGNVVAEPEVRHTKTGIPVTNFRLASTGRRYNRVKETYEDAETLWVSVVCWNDLARNAATSLRKGEPVIVYGRMTSRTYVKDEQRRMNYEVVADAVGHNLARGAAQFSRIARAGRVSSVAVADDGTPEDMTAELLARDLDGLRQRDAAFEAIFDGEHDPDAALPDEGDIEPLPDSGPLVPVG